MASKSFYRFHELLVEVDASLAGSFWPVWRWKLDPYKCLYSDEIPDLCLRSARGWEPKGPWQKKARRDVGLFFMDTFSSSSGLISMVSASSAPSTGLPMAKRIPSKMLSRLLLSL